MQSASFLCLLGAFIFYLRHKFFLYFLFLFLSSVLESWFLFFFLMVMQDASFFLKVNAGCFPICVFICSKSLELAVIRVPRDTQRNPRLIKIQAFNGFDRTCCKNWHRLGEICWVPENSRSRHCNMLFLKEVLETC